jgi:topoisomerase-4 subunit A
MLIIEQLNARKPISAIYFDGYKKTYFVKRFLVDNKTVKFSFITDHKDSYLEVITTDWRPQVEVVFVKEKGKERKTQIINIEEFISVKGAKAIGNKLTSKNVKEINLLEPLASHKVQEVVDDESEEVLSNKGIELNITNLTKNEKSEEESKEGEGQITLEL